MQQLFQQELNFKQDIIEFLALSCTKAKYKGGLWGSTLGRLKIYVTIALAIGIIGGIIALIKGGDSDAWSGVGLAEFFFLGIGGIAFFESSEDIIKENKVAAAWRDKFEQVILKGRSLRADAEFTQQLDFYENLLNKNKQSNNSLLAAFTSFKRK